MTYQLMNQLKERTDKMNLQKLNEFIDSHNINKSGLARDLNITPSALYQKLKGNVQFKPYELKILKESLNATNEQMLDFLDF